MKTLYIDVYFFINFTVDMLSILFSAKVLHIRFNFKKLLLFSFLSSLLSIFYIIGDESVFSFLINLSFLFILTIFINRKTVLFARRLKLFFLFIIFETAIGGLVIFVYSLLDRFLFPFISDIDEGSENRKALIFSAIILLTIGVFRLIIMMFSNVENEKSVSVKIMMNGNEFLSEGLVDTGNLLKDPMGMCPCILIKEKFAEEFLPKEIFHLCDIDKIDYRLKKRIRFIPLSRMGETHILTGVRADDIFVKINDRFEEVDATLAIDKEGGSFGGYNVLLPKLTF